MLLVSLVHQFIWLTFTLVLTRNGIFKYSQKPRLVFSRGFFILAKISEMPEKNRLEKLVSPVK